MAEGAGEITANFINQQGIFSCMNAPEIEMNGHMQVLGVRISEEAVDPGDIQMLQDLLQAAFSDALYKIKEKIREEVSSLTGGLNLPPGILGM